MVQQDRFEYKLEVGSLSSEADALYLVRYEIGLARNKVGKAKFILRRTTDSRTIAKDDVVKFYRREIGEITWGDSIFYGRVRGLGKNLKSKNIPLYCLDMLQRIADRKVPTTAWGNTHIVDKEYPVSVTNHASGYNQLFEVDLNESAKVQVPLESVRVLEMKEYVNSGLTETAITTFTGLGSGSVPAQCFRARAGTLRKIWLKGYRAAGAFSSNFRVQIRPDSNGIPSGTNIVQVDYAYSKFGSGAGADDWIEFDLLNNASDPKVLNLVPGQLYWIVCSAVLANGNIFYLDGVASRPQPINRYLTVDTGGGFTASGSVYCLKFGMDFENDWVELEDWMYEVYTDASVQKLRFARWAWGGGDDHYGNIRPYEVPELLKSTGTHKFVRCSFWKGEISYSTVITKWAQDLAGDLYDTLSVSITEPDHKQYCISGKGMKGLQAFELIRKYCPVVVRIYYSTGGAAVLEVRDEKDATDTVWNALSATQKAKRTFTHGHDSPGSSNEVRILDMDVRIEAVGEDGNFIITDERGKAVGMMGDGGLGILDRVGSMAGNLSDGIGFAEGIWETYSTDRMIGYVELSGIDQSVASGPFRQANEIVLLTATKIDIIAQKFAVESVTWSGGIGEKTKILLTFSERILETVSRSKAPGGAVVIPAIVNLMPGTSPFWGDLMDLVKPFTGEYNFGNTFNPQGASDCPAKSPRARGGQGEQAIISVKDLSYIWDNANPYYQICIGTGTPAGVSLGAEIAAVKGADLVMVDSASSGVIGAFFSEADIDLDTTWPLTITEIGLKKSNSDMGPWTAVWAKKIATDGTGDIHHPQIELVPGRGLAVFVRIDVP